MTALGAAAGPGKAAEQTPPPLSERGIRGESALPLLSTARSSWGWQEPKVGCYGLFWKQMPEEVKLLKRLAEQM